MTEEQESQSRGKGSHGRRMGLKYTQNISQLVHCVESIAWLCRGTGRRQLSSQGAAWGTSPTSVTAWKSEWHQDCTQHLCSSMILPVCITVNSLCVPSFWQGPPAMLRNLFGGFLPKELPVSEQRAITLYELQSANVFFECECDTS